MEAQTVASPVHYYDTHRHLILCGLHGFERHRSTKHPRSVTCPACVGLLHEQPALAAAGSPGGAVA